MNYHFSGHCKFNKRLFGGGGSHPSVQIQLILSQLHQQEMQQILVIYFARRGGSATVIVSRIICWWNILHQPKNAIDQVITIQTTGNGVDFGDLIRNQDGGACSDSHGGL